MTILCGTDWTEPGARAVEVAVALAERMREPVRLIHVFTLPGAEAALRDRAGLASSRLRNFVQEEQREIDERLAAEAARLARPGVPIETATLYGHSDQALVAEAARLRARLVVIGAIGKRPRSWSLGSTADRVAQGSHAPVLVVREPQRLLAWAHGDGPLRIAVGLEATPVSDAALLWLENLRSAGPCEVRGIHVYWPPEVRERLKLAGGIPIGAGHADVEALLARELREHLAELAGGAPVDLRIVGGLGRVAEHVVEAAGDADLIAVGSHQRKGLNRLWNGSVTRGVLDAASVSVLSVPSS